MALGYDVLVTLPPRAVLPDGFLSAEALFPGTTVA